MVPGGQIQLECWIVINCFIADLNYLTRSLLVKILSENREEERLDAINLLDDKHFSKSDGQLECGIKFLILVVENLQALFVLLEGLLEPLSCRGGGVDYQGSSNRVEDYDGIFHGESVSWKAFLFESEKLGFGGQESPDAELINSQGAAPLIKVELSRAFVLSSEISDVGATQK